MIDQKHKDAEIIFFTSCLFKEFKRNMRADCLPVPLILQILYTHTSKGPVLFLPYIIACQMLSRQPLCSAFESIMLIPSRNNCYRYPASLLINTLRPRQSSPTYVLHNRCWISPSAWRLSCTKQHKRVAEHMQWTFTSLPLQPFRRSAANLLS